MKIQIQSINAKEEVIWLKAIEDCTLSQYLILDTTYTDDSHISNEHRHIYWFPPKAVKSGDWIKLLTHNGTNTKYLNTAGTTTYVFYWGLGSNVWNNKGDAATLIEINNRKTSRVYS